MKDVLQDCRLGIIAPVPAARDAQGRLCTNHATGRLVDLLRERVPRARLCIPVLPSLHGAIQHTLAFAPEDVVDLPPLSSVIESQRYYFQTRRIIRRFANSCDVLFMRMPFQIPTALRRLGVPKLMHVVANPYEVVSASTDYHGLKRVLALRFAAHSNATMRRMAAEPATRVATNGSEMWNLLRCRKGRVVVSSCIYRHEMRPRPDLAASDPPRILFVGYLRPEKGIGYLLDAFESLRRQRPLKLTLVGGTDRNSNAEARAHERIRTSPYRDDITVTGMLDFGEGLFEHYRSHDVYAAPSLSEGTPRTIVEARANGCPVVGTRVGGIPDSIEDGVTGLLVAPANSQELAAALQRVLSDAELRANLIRNGLELSAKHSLEGFTDQLVDELRILVTEAKHSAARA